MYSQKQKAWHTSVLLSFDQRMQRSEVAWTVHPCLAIIQQRFADYHVNMVNLENLERWAINTISITVIFVILKRMQSRSSFPGKTLWTLQWNCIIIVLFQICHSIARMEEVEGEREDGTAQGGGAGGKGEGVLWSANFTLPSAHCKLYTSHCTLHTSHCTLNTANFRLHIAEWKLNTVHCIIVFL